MFIGEAPGEGEDILGKAFVGPSGKLLDKLINEAWYRASGDYRVPPVYFTNTVWCRPPDEEGKNREPTASEVKACRPNLERLIKRYPKKIIIFVGNTAQRFCRKMFKGYETYKLFHPAYLLRKGGSSCGEYFHNKQILIDLFKSL